MERKDDQEPQELMQSDKDDSHHSDGEHGELLADDDIPLKLAGQKRTKSQEKTTGRTIKPALLGNICRRI